MTTRDLGELLLFLPYKDPGFLEEKIACLFAPLACVDIQKFKDPQDPFIQGMTGSLVCVLRLAVAFL